VFGILKRGGKVYALPVADASGPTLLTTALQTNNSLYSRDGLNSNPYLGQPLKK
jgi:hypothetical protein